MKAKRLARLLRDQDAISWLDLEIRGYPENFNFSKLGSCYQYAAAGGRIDPTNDKYWPQSLPEIEAAVRAEEKALSSMGMPSSFNPSAENYVASGATLQVFYAYQSALNAQKQAYNQVSQLRASLKSCIHAYVMETYMSLELGDMVGSLFEEARTEVDAFVRTHVPRAAEQLASISDRLREGTRESLSSALNSCRRLLADSADSVFPPNEGTYSNSAGNDHEVGQDDYKNRILAFLDQSHQTSDTSAIVRAQMDDLAARLDAVYELSCKGVHADVTPQEARLAVIHTYLVLAEIARAAQSKS